MAVKKIEELNIHRDVNSTEQFDVQGYLNENWDKMQDVVDNNAEELMQVQKDISTLKEDNKTNKSSIDVLEKSNETRDGKISKNTEDIEAIQGSIKTATETINKKDNEQDEDIKANKESIEELQAENLEIKAENERLREDIKSIATIGEASGENIHLEDSSDARCELEICGNHQQDTREGYNQFKITSTQTQSAGVTITKIDESSVSYQGTTTGMFTHMLVEYDGKGLEITKQMYLKAFGNLTNAILSVKLIKNGKTESSYLRVSPDLILSAGDVLQQIYVQQQNTGILISGTLQVLLTDYENKDKPYEQYGASPSILYPSSAKAVGDIKNILDMSNAKGGTSGGITCAVNEDGSYSYVGTASSKTINIWLLGSYSNKTSIFRLEPGTYYIDGVMLYDANNPLANPDTAKIFTFINAHDITGVRTLDAVLENTYDETKYPIIAKIDHEIPWVPYDYGYAKIDIFNKNYLSKIPKKSITAQGVTSTFDGEKFICKGTAQTNYFNLFTEKVYKKISKGIKTFSTNKLKKGRAFIHFDYVDGTGQNYYTSINTNQVRFTLNKDVKSYRLNVDSITAGDTIDDNIYVQLEDGNIATEIEKAENQEYLVDVQQEMLEGDYLDLENEKEHHEWGKYIFTGDEDYNKSQTYSNEKYFCGYISSPVVTNIKLDKKGLCNCFRRFGDFTKILDEECIRIWGQFQVRILASHLTENSAEAFKTWLKSKYDEGNPVVVYYQLETPIELDFTNRQKLIAKQIKSEAHTYKNITNISAESAEINPIVNVKYLKDTETEHNKLQAQINEIKQLLSTTETSALLVNNLEKDLRMEVE